MMHIKKINANRIVITTSPVIRNTTYVKYTASSGLSDWEGDIVGELTSSSIPNKYDIEEVEIGNHVTSLGDDAFARCANLTSASMTSNIGSIGNWAFKDCSKLTKLIIGNKVSNIGSDSFYGCTLIDNVSCFPNPETLTWNEGSKNDFKSDGSTLCHVKAEYLTAYQTKFGDEVNVTFVGDLT